MGVVCLRDQAFDVSSKNSSALQASYRGSISPRSRSEYASLAFKGALGGDGPWRCYFYSLGVGRGNGTHLPLHGNETSFHRCFGYGLCKLKGTIKERRQIEWGLCEASHDHIRRSVLGDNHQRAFLGRGSRGGNQEDGASGVGGGSLPQRAGELRPHPGHVRLQLGRIVWNVGRLCLALVGLVLCLACMAFYM